MLNFYLNTLFVHEKPISGKIFFKNLNSLDKIENLLLSYTPGVGLVSNLIFKDFFLSYKYTIRKNLVAVLTNGTAILGLGNLGNFSSKPVMEGKSILFKKFADINSYDIEINQYNSKNFINIVLNLECTFSGINLEDIKSPNCFYIEKVLCSLSKIPIFHDDQHGTAIVAVSFILNCLKYLNKNITSLKLLCIGAGAAALNCVNMLLKVGLKRKNIFIFDSKGLLSFDRSDLNNLKKNFIFNNYFFCNIEDFNHNYDILLCCSAGGKLTFNILNLMNKNPIILTLSNPTPEVFPEISKFIRNDSLISTGRSDYYNQVNNLICYPYLFRCLLDFLIISIFDFIKLRCVFVISNLVFNNFLEKKFFYKKFFLKNFYKNFLIPHFYDPRLIIKISFFVSKVSIKLGFNNFFFKNYIFYLKKISLINLR